MRIRQIIFPQPNRAELIEKDAAPKTPYDVVVKTVVSTISPGTERANITGDANVAGKNAPDTTFPRSSGYNSAGVVESVGEAVTSVKPGDRVVVYWGKHQDYNIVPEEQVVSEERALLSEGRRKYSICSGWAGRAGRAG